MHSQLRLVQLRAVRAVLSPQRRLLATPPTGPTPGASRLPPTPPSAGSAPVRPVVVTAPPTTPGSSTLASSPTSTPVPPTPPPGSLPPTPPPIDSLSPPPPPPPPTRPRHFLRRFLIYTTLGILTFYPLSGYVSTHYEAYREFFTSTFPGGEAVADYADDHAWESFGYGTVSQKAVQGWQYVTGDQKKPEKVKDEARDAQRSIEGAARRAEADTKAGLDKLGSATRTTAGRVEDKAKSAAERARTGTKDMMEQMKAGATDAAGRVQRGTNDAAGRIQAGTKSAVDRVQSGTQSNVGQLESKAGDASTAVKEKAAQARNAISGESSSAISSTDDAVHAASAHATSLRERMVDATQDMADKASALASDAKAKVSEATSTIPFNFSDGVEGMVREAEKALGREEERVEAALHRGETRVEEFAEDTKDALTPDNPPRGLADTQRPRELRPETVQPKRPSTEGKELYAGPPLPLGHEPPPGYYLAPPPGSSKGAIPDAPEIRQTLPLLGPKVKEFASEEPIISQLASTIDSLTASLSTTTSPTSPDASGILSRAQDDLTTLSKRLKEVKQAEKEKLERTVGEKTQEFEAVLQGKEDERLRGEQGLKEGWDKERQNMVDEWRHALEGELETQREGIEQRLREEVVSQGIELQRRWLRSIKSQVETERGGRLAKLDHLTTSLKQLERITLDNSAHLDDNVRLHKMWSALRAVQGKAEAGDVAFDDELRALKSLPSPSTARDDSVIQTTLGQLEHSGIAQTGVKSLAALSSWFTNSVSPRVQSASLVPAPEDATVLSHLASAGLSRLMFRPKAGAVEGDDVGSVLARAEWCLGEKDLDGAAREVNSLKGWPGKLAADWLREARRRLEVQQALDVVATEATLSSLLLV